MSPADADASAGAARELRSFVAVSLPAALQAGVFESARGLAAELPDVRFTAKVENLHVTVKFLGKVAPDRLAALIETLGAAMADRPAFSATVRGLGAFPSERRAQVIWAGVDEDGGQLAAAAATVEDVAEKLGFVREERGYNAHVTVGRCKRGVDARAALEAWRGHTFGRFTVDALDVYESQLGKGGSTYVRRGVVQLRPSGAGAAAR